MPLALLIPLLAPLVTELAKWFVKEVIPNTVVEKIPSTLVPVVSTVVGGLVAYYVPDLDVTPLMGAELGLAGTGVHQVVTNITLKGK